MLFAVLTAGSALAYPTTPTNAGNFDMLRLEEGVRFPHKTHFETIGFPCITCHKSNEGEKRIEGFGKDWAHKKCIGCHSNMAHAPTECDGCHKISGYI